GSNNRRALLFDASLMQFLPLPDTHDYFLSPIGILLGDGTVLLTGASILTDRFDGTAFQLSGDVFRLRSNASGTLLGSGAVDGNALVAGALRPINELSDETAELYDPVAGVWQQTASMSVGRRNFSLVTLNDGTALACGGVTMTECPDPDTCFDDVTSSCE